MNSFTFLGWAATKVAMGGRTGRRVPALLAIFVGLAPIGFGQSITYPADGTAVTAARDATVSTAISVTGGSVVSSASNNPAVATVINTTSAVSVTGVSNGSATITYTITGGTSRTLAVTVIDPAVVLPSNLFVNDVVVGRASSFTLQTFPIGGVLAAASTSSNPAIATVTHLDATTLRVAGVALGTTSITLTASINGSTLTRTFTVNVRNPYVSAPAEGEPLTLPAGGNLGLSVFTIPNGGTLSSASVANPAIARATFSGRKLLLTGLAPGTTTVTYQTAIDGYTATNTLALAVSTATGASHAITFPTAGATPVGAHLSLAATSDAVPPYLIRYAVISGAGTLDGSTYTPAEPGVHVLRAYHNGSDALLPAYQDMSFTATTSALVPSIQWNAGPAITPGTALGPLQFSAQAVDPQGRIIPGTFAYSPAAGTVLGIGANQPLSATFTPADAANFSSATATTTITVGGTAVDPGVVWNPPGSIMYGTALGATELNATARVPGTFVYSPAAGTVLNAGTNQVLRVTFTPSNATHYVSATASTTITVTKLQPVITWPRAGVIVYGTPLGTSQLNATADVPGTFAYSPPAGTVINAGNNQTLSVTFTPSDATNYNSATASTTITVTQREPTITWPAPAAVALGTALGATQLNATANVPGTFVYGYPAGTVLNSGGLWYLHATFTPSDTLNYRTTQVGRMIVVNKATPVLTWAEPAAITYGTWLNSAQLNATANVPGTFFYSPGGDTVLNAGVDHLLSVTFTPDEPWNYTTASASTTIAVTKAVPVITWSQPQPIALGTPLSEIQLNATANVPGTFGYSPVAGTMLNLGADQPLSVAFAPTDTANYESATASTAITVTKASPVLTWAPPDTITYGTALSATQLNASANVPGTFVYSPSAGTVLDTGPDQTLSVTFTPADTVTYDSATASTMIAVAKAQPTLIWPAPAAITFGAPLSASQLNATADVPGTFAYSPAVGTLLSADANQTLGVTFTPTDTANYHSATASTTISVTRTQPTVTWPAPTALTYGTPLSATQLNATASVPGTFAYSPAAGTVLDAGANQTLSVTFTPSNAANYISATASTTITVTKAQPTVTWPAPTALTYGTALSATQLNATAIVPGTFAYSPAAGTVLNTGNNQPLSVTFTPTNTANYSSATASTTITVNASNAALTWNPPAAITYGTALSSTQLNATASVPGTFAYSPAAGTVLDAGANQTLSVTFTPADTVNHTGATASTTISVTKAQPTVTWPAPTALAYGTALSATQFNATASVPGTFAYSPAAGTVLDAGANQTLSVTFTPSNAANYISATASTTISVTKAQPTLAWPAPAALTYGTALSAAQLNATASVPGTFAYTPPAGTVLDAGSNQTLSVNFTPSNTANYISATASTTISVAKAQPTLTWPAPTALTYGTALSATQLNATASVPGSFAYSPAAGTVLNAGANQTLSVTFTPSNTANYNSATASTTITVSASNAALTWNPPTAITYGTALSATQLNATASVPGTFAYSPAAGTVLDAGANQTLSVTFTPADTVNHTGATASTTITVNASNAALTWNPPEAITYGTALSATQLNATASVTGTFAYTPASGSVLAAGAQTLSATFTPIDTANYSPSTRSVALTVNRAPLTVTAIDATRLAGTPNPAFTASYAGFVNGDTPAVVTGLSFATTATVASPASTYPITPSGASAANYQISFVAGTLTVSPATQTVTLTHGAVSVIAGTTGAVNAATAAALSFTATGAATGIYTWTVDGAPQPTTGGTLTTSFLTPGSHTVNVLATADPGHAASPAATITVTVAAGEFWTVAVASGHTLALMGDGTLRAWGRNDRGQLGDGTTTDQPIAPTTVTRIAGAIAIAAGGSHSLAITNDGSVWAWGGNDRGQLGNNTVLGQPTPVRLTALAGAFVQIAAGAAHTLALRSDGTVWSWGANTQGQLGDGTTIQRNVPVLLAGLTDAVAIAAGANHSLAVKADGTVWSWGGNIAGQLGDGTTNSRLSPTPVSIAAARFVDIAGGEDHTLALADNGTVWAWGDNAAGQLGDGTTTARPTPAQISGLTNVARLAAGRAHSAALKLDGTLWSWGDNHDGQLGDGSTTPLSSPTKVNGVIDAVDQAAGGNRTVLVTLDGAVRILGSVPGPIAHPDQRIAAAPLRLISSTADTDQDGMADALERQYFSDLSHSGAVDSDGDGLADVQELFLATNPVAPYDHDPDPTLSIVSGDHQVALTGQFNAQPFDVAIWSHDGARPLVNASVTFTVVSGGGLLATTNLGAPAVTSTLTQVTDVDGTVKVYYRQPSVAYVTSQVSVVAANSQISLSTLSTGASDTDGNHLLDTWEDQYFGAGHPPVDPTGDPDHDGLTNLVEMTAGTSPVNPDSDSDGMNDGLEYDSGRNPLDAIDSVPLPQTYLLVMKTPDPGYLGLKSNWTVNSVNAP